MLKIRILKPSRTQVLIYDSLGLEFLQEAIAEDYSVQCLIPRTYFPVVLRWSFLYRFLLECVNRRFRYRVAYLVTLIDQYNPQVVITFSDTSPIPGEYGWSRPDTLVLSVQNALRDSLTLSGIRKAPVYMAFGHSTKLLFEKENIPYQRMITVGSVILGLFLSHRPMVEYSRDLVFVSSYRVDFEVPESENTRITKSLASAHKCLFLNLLRYSYENNLNLTVIAKGKVRYDGEHFTEEENYFKKLSGGKPFTLSSTIKNTYKSYSIGLSANLLVALDSTLAYEMFSIGKKVLFGIGISKTLSKERDHDIEFLPEEVLLTSKSYDHFREKINSLRSLNKDEYESSAREKGSIYINQQVDCPPHKRINDEIKKHLERNI